MPAVVRRMDDPVLPDVVYLDTSFLFRHSIPPDPASPQYARYQREGNACRDFAQRLTQAAIPLWASDWVFEEFVYVYSLVQLKALAEAAGMNWRAFKAAQPQAIGPVYQQTLQLFDAIKTNIGFDFLSHPQNTASLRSRASQLMVNHNLLSRDAYHLSICDTAGITAIASADGDFARADGYILYSCNEPLVGPFP